MFNKLKEINSRPEPFQFYTADSLWTDKHTSKHMLDYHKKFDLITMIMCDFCALSPEQRKTMLSKFYNFSNIGGSVFLDVYTITSFNQREETASYEYNQLNNFWSSEDYYCFLNTFKYDIEKVILDKYTIIEKERNRTVYNWLQYFSPESLTEEFEENGFKIEEYFSDVAGKPFDSDSSEFAVIAKKYCNIKNT